MDKPQNRFISVVYQLYTITDGQKNLEEQTSEERPFELITGFGIALDRFEEEVIKHEKGATFDFTLQPAEAFGIYDPEGVHKLGREVFTINGHFDHDNIFAQAYALWQEGYHYYFSDVEIEWLNDRNSRFAVANLEKQLVFRYFRKPTENESGELVDTAMALQVISYNVGPKIYPDKVDAAFADLGFEEKTVNGMSGYLAVRRKPEEIAALARLMAQDAKQQPPKT